MTPVHTTKTLTENLLLRRSFREPAGGASRCGQLKRSDSRVGSVKGHGLSNGTRFPPLRDRTCWSLKGSPFEGDNQGGTANVNSSLRLLCSLRDFFFQGVFIYEADQNQ